MDEVAKDEAAKVQVDDEKDFESDDFEEQQENEKQNTPKFAKVKEFYIKEEGDDLDTGNDLKLKLFGTASGKSKLRKSSLDLTIISFWKPNAKIAVG